jgi:urease accessory protein
MPVVVTQRVAEPDASLPVVRVRADRRTLARRIWRGVAEDGTDFGFDLETPLRHGDTVLQQNGVRHVIEQEPEDVLLVALAELPPSAIAGVGWAVGNLHLDCASDPKSILLPDEPAARALLGRIQVSFTSAREVFRPGRFARKSAAAAVDLGPAHKHPGGTVP